MNWGRIHIYTMHVLLPDAINQGIHALVYQVSVGLPQTKALLFKHFGEA